jgi:hypothetical protein
MLRRLAGICVVVGICCMHAGRKVEACGIHCNVLLGIFCEGQCDGDVCSGTEMWEYSCTNGSILYVPE